MPENLLFFVFVIAHSLVDFLPTNNSLTVNGVGIEFMVFL